MAKKPRKEAVKPEQSKQSLAKAKYDLAKVAKKAARAVSSDADASEDSVAASIVPAAKWPKQPRFVREKNAKRPRTTSTVLPQRSTSASVRLMSKGLALPPKEDRTTGPMPMR